MQVIAPARLHLGFIDLREEAPRRFGSLGIALQDPLYRVVLRPAQALKIIAENPQKIQALIERFDDTYGLSSRCEIEVMQSIPEHSGLGSGTQLALATGHLLSQLHQLPLSSTEIASALQRGKRSGIGVGAFDHGGFIVDGGKPANEAVPPVVSQLPFPAQWRIVLIFDHSTTPGLHGADERNAFDKLAKRSAPSAEHLSHIVLMRLLPALVEQDYRQFSESLGDFQEIVGDYFAHFQGGRYSSTAVAEILQSLIDSGVRGVGQSSWGPTAYVIAQDTQHAQAIQSQIRKIIAASNIDPTKIELLETSAK